MVQAKFAFKKMMNKYILWNLILFFVYGCARVLENMHNNTLKALFSVGLFFFFPGMYGLLSGNWDIIIY